MKFKRLISQVAEGRQLAPCSPEVTVVEVPLRSIVCGGQVGRIEKHRMVCTLQRLVERKT